MKSGWKAFFPNLLTSLNLLAGCVALVSVFNGKYVDMAILVVAALVFDLLDGLVARALGVSSPFGRELDSLADMVTFGLVPGVVMYQLFCSSDFASDSMDGSLPVYLVWIPFLITVFSALRLAKFNLDTRQADHFIGLPTPANTIWIISLPLISVMMPGEFDFLIKSGWVLSGLTLVSCWLLVAELPMLSFKLKSFSLRKYPGQFILVAASIVFAVLFSVAAAPIIILFYVLLSIFFDYRSKQVS